MVSTRHHPRPFPPPEAASPPTSTSKRVPETPTSATASSRTLSDSPTRQSQSQSQSQSTVRSRSRKRKSTTTSPPDEDKTESLKSALTRSTSKPKRSPSRSRSHRTKQSTLTSTTTYTHTPPPLLIPWLLISLPLVIWDTLYILLRPHTMPGGRLHYPIWAPYELYGRIDHMYGWPAYNSQNGFTAAQGTMNALETACYIYYLYIVGRRISTGDGFIRGVALRSFNLFARRDEKEREKIVVKGGEDVAGATLLLFLTLILTSAKTVLYALNEYYSGWKYVRHNFEEPLRLIGLWILPNGPWIFVPAVLGWVVGKEIVEAMCTEKGGRKKLVD